MRVPAFTQSYGDLWDYDDREFRQERFDRDGNSVELYSTRSRLGVENSQKFGENGDHKSPYYYRRLVRKITLDRPLKTRTNRYGGLGEFDGYWLVEKPLSTNRGLGVNLGEWTYNEHMQNSINEANVKALNSLADAKAQLAVDIAESNKTFTMIADNAQIAARALLAAKRGQWTNIPDILGMSKRDVLSGRFAANRWLEYQYGWKPLFGALHDYQEAYKEGLKKKSMLITGKGRGSFSFQKKESSNGSSSLTSAFGGASTKYTARVTNEYLLQANRLGVINPAAIAWELYPFSFVVDWFVPIGDVLSAATATAGLEFVSGHTTQNVQLEFAEEGWGTGVGEDTLQQGMYRESWGLMQRGVETHFKFPVPYADTDPFGKNRRSRAVSALALIRQLF